MVCHQLCKLMQLFTWAKICPAIQFDRMLTVVILLRPEQNGYHMAGDIFKCISSIKRIVSWFKFHWSLFPMAFLTRRQHWFRWWFGAGQATNHYLNQWWRSSLTHIRTIGPQWVKYTMTYSVLISSRKTPILWLDYMYFIFFYSFLGTISHRLWQNM